MGVKYIKVIDDSFLETERDEEWTKRFRDKIKERGIDVSLRGSLKADQVEDKKMQYLKEAGFHSNFAGRYEKYFYYNVYYIKKAKANVTTY